MMAEAPFYCGSQYHDWTDANCEGCKKAFGPKWDGESPWTDDDMPCDIERTLFYALLDDGTVSDEIAERMGCNRWPNHNIWPCPERDPPWKECQEE